MKIAVIGGAGVRTVIFINGLLKRYKKLHNPYNMPAFRILLKREIKLSYCSRNYALTILKV